MQQVREWTFLSFWMLFIVKLILDMSTVWTQYKPNMMSLINNQYTYFPLLCCILIWKLRYVCLCVRSLAALCCCCLLDACFWLLRRAFGVQPWSIVQSWSFLQHHLLEVCQTKSSQCIRMLYCLLFGIRFTISQKIFKCSAVKFYFCCELYMSPHYLVHHCT